MKKTPDQGYSFLEPTADIGIKIWAGNYRDLINISLQAIVELIFGKKLQNITGNIKESKPVKINGIDKEELLVSFLNEIIYLVNVKKWLAADVMLNSIDMTAMDCTLHGFSLSDDILIINEIKAATYHNVKLVNNNGSLETSIILDV